jgi:hypothetical protein
VKDWKVSLNKLKGWVRIGGNRLSISKLQSHFGKEVCPFVAATRLKGRKAAAVCPLFGESGHTHSGRLHNLDDAKHNYVQQNIKEFRWKAADQQPSGPGSQPDSKATVPSQWPKPSQVAGSTSGSGSKGTADGKPTEKPKKAVSLNL